MRRDTFIVAGQPNYMSLAAGWFKHGREITAGDAEATLDLAPGTTYPLASIGSGEGFLEMEYSIFDPYTRGTVGIVHNLQDIGASIRAIVGVGGDVQIVQPTTTEDQVNTTDGFAKVDQDPYGTVFATEAAPTDPSIDWSLRVGGFANAAPLASSAGGQTILVRVKFNNDYPGPSDPVRYVTINAYDGADLTPVESKTVAVLAVAGEVFTFALRVTPSAFDDPLLTALEVEVVMEGANDILASPPWWHWTVQSISWLRVKAAAAYDSAWQNVEATGYDSGSWDLYPMAADAQQFTGLPYWGAADAEGVIRVQNISAGTANKTWLLFYWDDSNAGGGRPRIFGSGGERTGWLPEIGETIEGPAYGTPYGDFGNTFSTLPRDVVRLSLGAERWVTRNESPRRAGVTIPHQGVDVAVTRLLRVLRRAGQSRPFMFINFSDLRSWSELSIYGPLTWTATQTPRTRDQLDDSDVLRFSVRIDVEEAM